MNPEKYGNKVWYDSDGKFHRDDGHAVEWTDGGKFWLKHGKYHREDGPAVKWASGNKAYYLEGIQYTEEEYWEKIKELKKCKLFKLSGGKINWL